MELYELTIHQAHNALRQGTISSVELTRAVLERIEAVDGRIHAYLRTTPQDALAAAEDADRRRAAGEDGPLLGIPLAIKDVLSTAGVETTCASRILEGYVPPYDATVVARLRQAGAVLVGKTNTDEFAMGSSTETSAAFVTRNPWNLDRVSGGSSGGSAAAVAADACLGALGTDTGGSVRQPAALCGVVGLKPTYGRVSRYGLVAFASSLDQVGPLAKDVMDSAILLGAIAGHDPRDATAADLPVPDYAAALRPDVAGMRLGLPHEYLNHGMDPAVEAAVRAAVAVLEGLGAEIVEVSMPHTEYALPAYYLIATAEASANLARYDGLRYGLSHPEAPDIWEAYRRTRQEGFGAEVKRRIMLGTYALSAGYYDAYYLKAQKVRTLIKQDFDRALEQCDALVVPTTPTTAFRIGEKVDDPLQMYLGDVFALPLNLAGLCGVSIPCGFAEGLPIGLQVLGGAFAEATILRVAYAYEQATTWHTRRPSL
ncbi:MAG TPA: Asp-tRNA(Asn)/Glu-tRNA(Gln) amidotransferase subunit GatA [Chloroflexi bacterium]|nr:Asp-tRNA(Asn)/Glu-tRNA(Gln) amidotransferase subunit GatA [Chloroflexota bacterium]